MHMVFAFRESRQERVYSGFAHNGQGKWTDKYCLVVALRQAVVLRPNRRPPLVAELLMLDPCTPWLPLQPISLTGPGVG